MVLEGGGVRGIYTAGVLDVFLENNLDFEAVIGVSAGAIHGATFLAGQQGRSIRYYLDYCKDPRFMSLKSLLTTGNFAEVDFCYHKLPEELYPYDFEAFKKCNVPFYATCTNVETGKAEYIQIHDMKDDIDYIRASASLPFFAQIVNIKGKKYLDGGCADSIPLKALQNMGYKRNVVILTRDKSYRKKSEYTWLSDIRFCKYPEFARSLKIRAERYNKQVDYVHSCKNNGNCFVIQPSVPLKIGRLEKNPEKIKEVYSCGVHDAKQALPSLLKWSNQTDAAV